MNDEKWIRQDETPTYDDILWSKPENKASAGSLLIVGGHLHALMAPIRAFDIATRIGIGEATVAMPDSVPPEILKEQHVEALKSSKSGGISKEAYQVLSGFAKAANVILWPGAIGRDSQTTQLIEKFLKENQSKNVLADDSIDSLIKLSDIGKRQDTCLVLTLAQLSAFNKKLGSVTPVVHSMQTNVLVEHLQSITKENPLAIVTYLNGKIICGYKGRVSTTSLGSEIDSEDFRWRLEMASSVAVFWAQFPEQLFEAMTTAAWQFKEDNNGE